MSWFTPNNKPDHDIGHRFRNFVQQVLNGESDGGQQLEEQAIICEYEAEQQRIAAEEDEKQRND